MEADLADLLAAWRGETIPDERRSSVLARLRGDPAFRAVAVEEIRLFAMLNVLRAGEPRWFRLEDELGWSTEGDVLDLAEAVAAEVATLPVPERFAEPVTPRPCRQERRRLWPVAAAAVLCAGVLLSVGYLWRIRQPVSAQQLPEEAVALLVRMDGPGWVGGVGPAVGEPVKPGVLSLSGGSATLALFNGVTLHVEGPAEVDVRSGDRVFCRRGKVRIDAPSEATGFTAQAPGTTVADPAAEFALTVGDDEQSEVAVYEGQARVEVLDKRWRAVGRQTLSGGQTVRIDSRMGQIVTAARRPQTFAGPIPALDPPLRFDPEYAAAVRADQPTAYWRFETAEGGRTPNEIAGGPALKLIGRAAPSARPAHADNRGLHFPPPTEWDQHGAISDGAIAPPKRDYALECWVMPRAVRQAALVGLVADADTPRLDGYGVLLELTGQPALFRHPSRSIRALHRLPFGRGRGSNQFATAPYLPYRWYHVVTQRAGDRLELYVDGELAAVGLAEGSPPGRHRILLGALYAARDGLTCSERPFIGTLDEVAVYGQSLSPEAVRKHFQLGHTGER